MFEDDESQAKKEKIGIWSDTELKKQILEDQKMAIQEQEEVLIQEQIENIILAEEQAVLAYEGQEISAAISKETRLQILTNTVQKISTMKVSQKPEKDVIISGTSYPQSDIRISIQDLSKNVLDTITTSANDR